MVLHRTIDARPNAIVQDQGSPALSKRDDSYVCTLYLDVGIGFDTQRNKVNRDSSVQEMSFFHFISFLFFSFNLEKNC